MDLRAFREAVAEAWAHYVELAEAGKIEDALDAFKANLIPLTFVFCGVVMLGSCVFSSIAMSAKIASEASQTEATVVSETAPPPPEKAGPITKPHPWSLD